MSSKAVTPSQTPSYKDSSGGEDDCFRAELTGVRERYSRPNAIGLGQMVGHQNPGMGAGLFQQAVADDDRAPTQVRPALFFDDDPEVGNEDMDDHGKVEG